MSHKHFDPNVPQDIREKLYALALAVQDDVFSEYSDLYGEPQINNISGVGYSGFIPFQDGGFEVSALTRNDIDSTYHLHPDQAEYLSEQHAYMLECFARDELNMDSDQAQEWVKGNYWADIEKRDLQNDFYEYETEWLGDALLRFEIWIDRAPLSSGWERRPVGFSDKQKVFWRLSANYRDNPYFREKYDSALAEGSFSAGILRDERFIPARFAQHVLKKEKQAWQKARVA